MHVENCFSLLSANFCVGSYSTEELNVHFIRLFVTVEFYINKYVFIGAVFINCNSIA